MSPGLTRRLAAIAAAALVLPAAALAKKPDGGHPGRGNGGPPSWVIDRLPEQAKGHVPGFVLDPAPAEVLPTPDAPAEGPSIAAIGEEPVLAPTPPTPPPAAAVKIKGKGKARGVMFVFRGLAAANDDGTFTVALTGGNRWGRRVSNPSVVVRPGIVVFDDESAEPTSDAPEVLFKLRLPRTTEELEGIVEVRKLVVLAPEPDTAPETEPDPAL